MNEKNHRPEISVIVPLYNSETTVLETLESVVNQHNPLSMQMIIIDDGSTDLSATVVQDWIAKTKLPPKREVEFYQQENRGEAAAVNLGLQKARGQYIAWVESDVRLDPEWLTLLLYELEEREVMGAGGLLLPAENDSAISKIWGYEIANKIISNHEYPRHITSANALYSAQVFYELGKCKEDLGESSFDSEFNQRIRDHGWLLKLNKEAKAWHHFKSSLTDCLRRTYWYGYRRPFVHSQVLYPADRWIGALVLLAALILPTLLLMPFFPRLCAILLGVSFLSHLFYGLFLYLRFSYRPLLISGPIFLLRNLVFFIAYGMGWLHKLKSSDQQP